MCVIAIFGAKTLQKSHSEYLIFVILFFFKASPAWHFSMVLFFLTSSYFDLSGGDCINKICNFIAINDPPYQQKSLKKCRSGGGKPK